MKKLLGLAAVLFLQGCTPLVYFKEGADVSDFNKDYAQCRGVLKEQADKDNAGVAFGYIHERRCMRKEKGWTIKKGGYLLWQ